MPRVKEYDTERVRAGLMSTFLEKGFVGSSLTDLEAGSGLNRRQLYNDFGDKKAVFLQAIRDFTVIAGEEFLGQLECSEAGVSAIRDTLVGMTSMADSPQGRLGCLICNTAREPIVQDSEVSKLVKRYFRRIERAYGSAINRAIQSGELESSTNSDSLARFFLGVHVSLCVMSRGGESVDVLTDIAEEAMRRLD